MRACVRLCVQASKDKVAQLEAMRSSFKGTKEEQAKLIMESGLGTITNLNRQLEGAKAKNRKLEKKVRVMTKEADEAKAKADADRAAAEEESSDILYQLE